MRRVFYKALGYYPISINGEKFKCDPYHVGFWRAVRQGQWETATFDTFQRFLNPESVYVDLGAWIGPTTLFAARKAKQVYCIEPDYEAYQHLLWNVRLNRLNNVHPFNLAIAKDSGVQRMANFYGGRLGNSQTSLLGAQNSDKGNSIDVSCVTWEQWLDMSQVKKIDFLKIDVEGAEFDLLPSMQGYLEEHRPTLYLSVHSPFIDQDQRCQNVNRLMEVLKIYPTCMDEQGNRLDHQTLQAKACENFSCFLLTK